MALSVAFEKNFGLFLFFWGSLIPKKSSGIQKPCKYVSSISPLPKTMPKLPFRYIVSLLNYYLLQAFTIPNIIWFINPFITLENTVFTISYWFILAGFRTDLLGLEVVVVSKAASIIKPFASFMILVKVKSWEEC